MRAAIYARYSGDRQRESSIEDQVRNCTRYVERECMSIVHVYQDRAVSGSVAARREYQAMLERGEAGAFDVLIVDDLSRLSRDDYEMKGVLRRLTWRGVRVLGVSDGYDSAKKGHKIHAGFKGLMNEVFLDDLRERTHRGMTGQAMKGYNCGGRTYGYRNVPIEDPARRDAYGRPAISAVRYEINETQAAVVRDIYAWYAEGYSYKWIASELNRRREPASRGGTWSLSAIKVILDNQMYRGRVTWNQRQWMKHPETGKRTYRKRPANEWVVSENPELRIVPEETIDALRQRRARNQEVYGHLINNSSAQRYLFSGLMVCAECGSRFVLAGGNRYGCGFHRTRGKATCTNSKTVARHIVEATLLRAIKEELLEPANVEKFKQAAREAIKRRRAESCKEELSRQLRTAERIQQNILTAIKKGILTESTQHAMTAADAEVTNLKRQIADLGRSRVETTLPLAIDRYRQAVADLERRVEGHIEPARDILKMLLGTSIRLHPRGEYLEAEIPNHVPALLAKSLNSPFDSVGCGGPMCSESTFVVLKA